MELAADPDVQTALELIDSGVNRLFEQGPKPSSSRDAISCVKALESLRRRMDAAALELQANIDAGGLFIEDGHVSAKAMVRHNGRLSDGEATVRSKTINMLRDLPLVAEQYAAGLIGTDHVRLLGRVFSNPRVRGLMPASQRRFLSVATLPYTVFEKRVRSWERLNDQDGPKPKAEATHENRNVTLNQNHFDLDWDLTGKFGAFQGAELEHIFRHYVHAEYLADWDIAKAEHGDAACEAHLPRTHRQRRADAWMAMARDAAANSAGPVPTNWVHNVVWDNETFEEMSLRLLDPNHVPRPLNPDTYMCETLDGVSLNPFEAAISAIRSKIRRVLIDAPSSVVDLGEARLFTGAARHAVKLQATCCIWPGCTVPTSNCEADHLLEYGAGGRTYPGNGAPLCGRHNRWKQRGFTIYRSPEGTWHTIRPDGTEIDP